MRGLKIRAALFCNKWLKHRVLVGLKIFYKYKV